MSGKRDYIPFTQNSSKFRLNYSDQKNRSVGNWRRGRERFQWDKGTFCW